MEKLPSYHNGIDSEIPNMCVCSFALHASADQEAMASSCLPSSVYITAQQYYFNSSGSQVMISLNCVVHKSKCQALIPQSNITREAYFQDSVIQQKMNSVNVGWACSAFWASCSYTQCAHAPCHSKHKTNVIACSLSLLLFSLMKLRFPALLCKSFEEL